MNFRKSYIIKSQNFTCLNRVKNRFTDRLSDSLTSDAKQWHNAGWDLCPQTRRVTSLHNFKNFQPNVRNNPNMSVSFLKWSRARRKSPAVSWAHDEDTEQSRSLPLSLRRYNYWQGQQPISCSALGKGAGWGVYWTNN